jgi:hypothetical protein
LTPPPLPFFMHTYRNRHTGEIVESAEPRLRLERLDAWETVVSTPVESRTAQFTGSRPSVWFVSPAHGRLGVTALALAQRRHLIDELADRGIDGYGVVVADDENLELAAEYGFEGWRIGNEYLGRRFNAGISFACREGADFVVHIGSDDWMHVDCFARLPAPDTILSGRAITVADLEAGKMRRCHVPGRHGVIPWVIPRALLEASSFAPVKPEKRRGIDGSLVRGLGSQPRWLFHDPHPFARIDWKTSANITPYALLSRNLGRGPELQAPWRQLEEFYPRDLVEQANDLHHQLSGLVAARR